MKNEKGNIGCLVVIIIFVIIILVGIFSSGDKNPSEKETTIKTTTVYTINQDVIVGDVGWILLDVKNRGNTLKASKSRHPSITKNKITTGKFIEITMGVTNGGKKMKTVSNLTIIDDKNREFHPAPDVSDWIPQERELFLLSNLNPGMGQLFTDIYEVPADAKGLKVKVGDLSF